MPELSPLPRWTSSGPAGSSAQPDQVLGSTTPRVWTPPLVELTPETSYGFDVIDFARDVLGQPLDEWQQWLVIHLGELLPDGRPRFRTALVIVARQNGKTHLSKVLTLYWLFVEKLPSVLGTSTDRSYAKRTWSQVCDAARSNQWLSRDLGPNAIRLTIGEESLTTALGTEYVFAANNRRAGRSMTLHRWVCDELREHKDRDCWNAATNAQNAVPGAQTVCITNMGDDASIVLDSLRESAVEYVETGVGDPRLGIFEWSSPQGSDPTDPAALALANPNYGRRIDPDALLGAAARAKRAGGIELSSFRTEVMCMRVAQLDPAVDPDLWLAAASTAPLDLAEHRDKVALCLDVSLDGSHATLVAAAEVAGTVHVEVVRRWTGYGLGREIRDELPAIAAKVRPRSIGWFPQGPAAAIAANMAARPRAGWPPRRVELVELRADLVPVCMGFAAQVAAGQVAHPADPLLDQHIASAQRLRRGDGWVFTRRGTGPVDAVYAAAGAVHLARTLPPAPPPLAVL